MIVLGSLSGCLGPAGSHRLNFDQEHFQAVATQIEYPSDPPSDEAIGSSPPRSIRDSANVEYWDMTLMEAIQLALRNSRVMLDLGGTVLRRPENVPTAYGPAVQETDPQFGVEAALSAFDAELSSSLFFEKNDRRLNNRFLGNLGFYDQHLDVFQTQITKRAATGSQFIVRNYTEFNNDNNLGNQFRDGAWTVWWEGEVRHPLLQGGGVDFNRIAGPGARPGAFNGVLIARLRTDISLADFEIGVRDLVSNVENAYWDLYYAYRNLDTRIRARDQALTTWRRIHAFFEAGRLGGQAANEAQAREQFFRFEEEVQNALAGRPLEGTRTNNGSSPGTFRGNPGVYANERKLRLLIGLPANDDRLIRPTDEPPIAEVKFDWNTLAGEALARREELRRQRWEVKSRELELLAARNFLLPNLDLVGRYRFRGFGQQLLDPQSAGKPRFHDAYTDLTTGDFQEWQLGMELSLPFGFRQAHAGLRHAELRLSQARATLREQERHVVHDLSNAVAELDRAYTVLQTGINRFIAARQQFEALEALGEPRNEVEVFLRLDAQRRLADAEDRYYQARVEYAMALRNVYFEKGSLLEYCGIVLAEGPWPASAYLDAAERERNRGPALQIDYRFRPPLVSEGPGLPLASRGTLAERPSETPGAAVPPGKAPANPDQAPVTPPGAPDTSSRNPSGVGEATTGPLSAGESAHGDADRRHAVFSPLPPGREE